MANHMKYVMLKKIKIPSMSTKGFSLVEVVLALSILVFCLVSLLGLIPMGLQSFRSAMTLTVESQIAQGLSGDLQLTDFKNLKTLLQNGREYYYDDQGMALDENGPQAIYTATVSLRKLESPAALTENDILCVQIIIANKTTPERKNDHYYSVIVANNNR